MTLHHAWVNPVLYTGPPFCSHCFSLQFVSVSRSMTLHHAWVNPVLYTGPPFCSHCFSLQFVSVSRSMTLHHAWVNPVLYTGPPFCSHCFSFLPCPFISLIIPLWQLYFNKRQANLHLCCFHDHNYRNTCMPWRERPGFWCGCVEAWPLTGQSERAPWRKMWLLQVV
jgi:hypothetical protein